MFDHLQIYDTRERWIVGMADLLLTAATAPARLLGRRTQVTMPDRILLIRLERIGDLLMSLPAITAVRRLAPQAEIDLIVGSWNAAIARLIEGVSRVDVLDASWLSRGAPAHGMLGLLRRSRAWRQRNYDLAINFEGDVRSHLLMSASGAPRRAGFAMAGGGSLLTDVQPYDATRHVADNLLRLVETAFGQPTGSLSLITSPLAVPADARARAEALLRPSGTGADSPNRVLVGINVGGGREIKQWDTGRFAAVASLLSAKYQARFVFTGGSEDRDVVRDAIAALPESVARIDLAGRADLLTLAAVLERCTVFVTGDTGPMHLAAAVGTPIVAIFGPSDPRRWGPLSPGAEIVHGDVACRPCNRIRRPPSHCVGHLPDCLAAVSVDQVFSAAERQILEAAAGRQRTRCDSANQGGVR